MFKKERGFRLLIWIVLSCAITGILYLQYTHFDAYVIEHLSMKIIMGLEKFFLGVFIVAFLIRFFEMITDKDLFV